MNFREIIISLVDSRREGSYWDFKREPHSNKASLLHDIICLANAMTHHNRYLIFGVDDPSNNCEIIGLQKQQDNRKSQAEFIDFLRTKKFSNGLRPVIELRTITVEQKEIDVLIIYRKPLKPYYLTEDYKGQSKIVRANYIYTRIQDTNTPVNKSADFSYVELMWKERFGLTIHPSERFKRILLEYEDWHLDIGNKNYGYYKPNPEFKIELGEPNEGHEPYELNFLNPEFHYGDIRLMYHSTIMHESQYIWLDGMRFFTSAPSTGGIELRASRVFYYYLNLTEVDGLLHYLFQRGSIECNSRGMELNFIYFTDLRPKNIFNQYVIDNEERFWDIEPTFFAKEANRKLRDHHSMGDVVDLENVNRIYQLWKEWYSHNNVPNDHVG